jgi:hypothetical protein
VYLKSYRSRVEAYANLEAHFRSYNDHRPLGAFGAATPKTPIEIYHEPIAQKIYNSTNPKL